MNFLKIGLLISALGLFVFACSQQANQGNNAANTNQIVVTNMAQQNMATPTNPTSPVAAGNQNSAANNSATTTTAAETFKTICAKCHKESGEGGEVTIDGKKLKTPNFKSERMKKDADEDFIDAIANGIVEEGMPAFKDRLSDAQIKDLVKYIRTDIQGK
jgi:cytochrome c6